MPYYGEEDEYDEYHYHSRRGRPSPQRYRSGGTLLSPHMDGGSLQRSRSQGQAPVPVVNVYNDMIQDGNFRNVSRSPPRSEYRGRRLDADLADDFVDLAIENRRLRSRSRGRSDAGALARPAVDPYVEYELRDRERQLREIERKRELELEEQHIKDKYEAKYELQRIKELERKRDLELEEQHIKDRYELQRIREETKRKAEEEAAKAERKRVIEEYERKQREEQDEKKRLHDQFVFEEAEKERKREEEKKRMREQFAREEEEKKRKEKEEYERFLLKQKEKEAKEKAEKEKHEQELENEMRERLMKHGYTYAQAERMIKDKKEEDTTVNRTTTLTTTTRQWGESAHRPTYAKIKKEYLSVDTLKYYDIPYEIDHDYIIILREMDKYETDVLFEHTRRLRSGKLLLEPAKKEKEYAWYRKRDRSTSRVRKVGILEFKS